MKVREAYGAGTWYPRDPVSLRSQIEGYLERAGGKVLEGTLIGVLCPHAGLRYSGPVAAHAYRQVRDREFDTVICFGLSHRMAVLRASVLRADAYETPLGTIPIDREVVDRLLKEGDLFEYASHAHMAHRGFRGLEAEHSVENQMPFLQAVLEDFSVVEVLIQRHDPGFCRSVGEAVAGAVQGRKTLVVASTDLSHFPSAADAERSDRPALEAMASTRMDAVAEELARLEEENLSLPGMRCVVCSPGAVLAAIATMAALGANRAEVLHYAHSGHAGGDPGSVVGYGSIAYLRSDAVT